MPSISRVTLTYELPLNTVALIIFFHHYSFIHEKKNLSQFPILQNKILIRSENTFTILVCSWKRFSNSIHSFLVVDISKPSHVEDFLNCQIPCKDSKGL